MSNINIYYTQQVIRFYSDFNQVSIKIRSKCLTHGLTYISLGDIFCPLHDATNHHLHFPHLFRVFLSMNPLLSEMRVTNKTFFFPLCSSPFPLPFSFQYGKTSRPYIILMVQSQTPLLQFLVVYQLKVCTIEKRSYLCHPTGPVPSSYFTYNK